MKEPVHRWKNYWHYANNSKPPRWSFDGQPCWLGSGVNDINGREIYEGDKVVFGEHDTEGVIVFKDAMFQIAHGDKFTVLGKCQGFIDVEVVGHIKEANL